MNTKFTNRMKYCRHELFIQELFTSCRDGKVFALFSIFSFCLLHRTKNLSKVYSFSSSIFFNILHLLCAFYVVHELFTVFISLMYNIESHRRLRVFYRTNLSETSDVKFMLLALDKTTKNIRKTLAYEFCR